jgi:hypothetical protein
MTTSRAPRRSSRNATEQKALGKNRGPFPSGVHLVHGYFLGCVFLGLIFAHHSKPRQRAQLLVFTGEPFGFQTLKVGAKSVVGFPALGDSLFGIPATLFLLQLALFFCRRQLILNVIHSAQRKQYSKVPIGSADPASEIASQACHNAGSLLRRLPA